MPLLGHVIIDWTEKDSPVPTTSTLQLLQSVVANKREHILLFALGDSNPLIKRPQVRLAGFYVREVSTGWPIWVYWLAGFETPSLLRANSIPAILVGVVEQIHWAFLHLDNPTQADSARLLLCQSLDHLPNRHLKVCDVSLLKCPALDFRRRSALEEEFHSLPQVVTRLLDGVALACDV